jgi:(p)ppGpp synthase/HD superfamily hydrolase
LHDLWLPLLFTTDDKIAKSFSADDLNDMLISWQDKRWYFWQIIRKIYGVQVPAPKSKSLAKKIDSNVIDVLIDGEYISWYQFCPECKPQFPDKIIAKLAVWNIKIHTMSCKALSSVSFDKIINAHWASQDSQIYNLDLEVRRHWNYYDMLEVISLLKDLHVDLVSFRIQSEKNFIVLYIKAWFVNLAKISFVLKQMKLRFNDVKISKKVLS